MKMTGKITGFKRVLPWLFWLGPMVLIAGLTAGVVSGSWGRVPVGLAIAGLIYMIGWSFWEGQGFWGRRSTQASTNAIVATLSVLVILGLINFLGTRYLYRLDLTENRLFTLAPQTQQVVKALKQPVKAWVFLNPADPLANNTRTFLERYRQQSPRFSFEIVDPNAQPAIAQAFGVKDLGDVYLESGSKRQFVQRLSEFEPLSEGKLTNSLEQITSDRQSKVYFLQGHGELSTEDSPDGLSQAITLLSEKNFTSETLNLAAKESTVPKDAAAVIVAGPKQALFEQEVKALQDYLNQGGSVLLLLDPKTDPKLDPLLKDWGVKLDDRLVISDLQTVEFGPAAPIINEYGDHPITKSFGARYSIYPLARPLEITPVDKVQATPLLKTGPKSWAETNLKDQNLQFNPDQGDRPGPLTLGVALTRPATAAPAKPNSPAQTTPATESRLVIIGNSRFAANTLLTQQFLNGDLLLNSVSWLSKREDQALSIAPKESKNRRLNLTPQQTLLINGIALGGLPLLGFATAVVLWWRRR